MKVYLLLSCCPCEGRISGIVDCPNAVATFAVPTSIFDQASTTNVIANIFSYLYFLKHLKLSKATASLILVPCDIDAARRKRREELDTD